ncbi:MAG: hypothetical protein B7X11_04220, partial [Acidobacteria bacterium 37-65-4]
MRRAGSILAAVLGMAACLGAGALQPQRQSLPLSRISAPIQVDGDLSDAGWRNASQVDLPYEIAVKDNGAPPVETTGWLAYDS